MAMRNSRLQDDVERRVGGSGMPPSNPAPERSHASGPNFVERKAAILFRFDGVGAFVEGKLMQVEQVEIQDQQSKQKKRVWQFTLFDSKERQGYKIIGTADINSKLSREDVGSYVRITLKGVDRTVAKNGNPMNVFEVLVAERQKPANPEITDEDIPF